MFSIIDISEDIIDGGAASLETWSHGHVSLFMLLSTTRNVSALIYPLTSGVNWLQVEVYNALVHDQERLERERERRRGSLVVLATS